MKRIGLLCSVFFILHMILTGCRDSKDDRQLDYALEMAGENRQELERVLEHFAGDSLKLEAAKFLIRNMPGHYSYADTAQVNRYYNSVDSMFDCFYGQPIDSIRNDIDGFARNWGIPGAKKVQDVKIITADFLIANIDSAFRQWQTSPWCTHLTFDEFCEYILPYKSEELQPLNSWRSDFSSLCTDILTPLHYADLYRNSSFRAATLMRLALTDNFGLNLAESVRYPVYRTSTRLRIPFGMCEDYVARTTVVFRAIGIPVVMEFTPQWSYGDNAHDWNVVLSRKGQEVQFSGFFTTPTEHHKPYENLPKAYRRTYAQNPELVELNQKEEYVPPFFRNIFMKDVTAARTSTAKIQIPTKNEADGYVYLAASSGTGWKPVALGRVKSGVATFEDVGRECIYLPVRYDAAGNQRAIGDPVRVKANGEIQYLIPKKDETHAVRLRRKYPVLEYVYAQAIKLIGGEFQAANKADFSDAVTVAAVTEPSSDGQEIAVADSIGTYRYWRYINHQEGNNASIAEIIFIGKDGRPVNGEVMGSSPLWDSPENAAANAFDGKLLTNFNAEDPAEGWAGMDFGRPISLGAIRYYARGDGNAIEPGDLYELLYWDGAEGWKTVGRKIAESIALDFDGVPANALLLLRDLTKGRNEHVFIYENREQRWW